MPSLRNKLLLNQRRTQGKNGSIHEAHMVIREYAEEIDEMGLLREALPFADKMSELCEPYDAAQDLYEDGLWDLAEEIRVFINKKRFPPVTAKKKTPAKKRAKARP